MKITYDPEADAAYIEFVKEHTEVSTQLVTEDIAIDFAPNGAVVGIEILDASAYIPGIATMQQVPVEDITAVTARASAFRG